VRLALHRWKLIEALAAESGCAPAFDAESHVPRFYFDVREGTRFSPDDEGLEYPNVDTAERMAAEAAASIGRDVLPKSDVRDVTVEVRNEHKQRIITVTVTMQTERVSPEPTAPS
jgi:hypothetical protein